MQSLQHRLGDREKKNNRLVALFDALRGNSDFEATRLLARLRMGESLAELSIPVFRFGFHSERPLEN